MPSPSLIGDPRTESILTAILPCGQTTHVPAHSHKTIEVVLQALIRLLVQTGNDAELCPVKSFLFLIINDAKGGHRSVEVCLLSPSPPWDLTRRESELLSLKEKKKSQQLLTYWEPTRRVRRLKKAGRPGLPTLYLLFKLSWGERLIMKTARYPTTTFKSQLFLPVFIYV